MERSKLAAGYGGIHVADGFHRLGFFLGYKRSYVDMIMRLADDGLSRNQGKGNDGHGHWNQEYIEYQ